MASTIRPYKIPKISKLPKRLSNIFSSNEKKSEQAPLQWQESSLNQQTVEHPKDAVTVTSITWNMGGDSVKPQAISDLYRNLRGEPDQPHPTVICINTQEEMAEEGERLQDAMLARLNKDLPPEEQYELVQTAEPQWNKTTAGAKGPVTLAQRTVTDHHRVSAAVLVKKPYKLDNAHARIDYEPNIALKGATGNKSIITISGELKLNGNHVANFKSSGCHLDSNSDQKRRAHINYFNKQEGLTGAIKSFDQIVKEAATIRIFSGDINERNLLYKDGSTANPLSQTNLSSKGYNMTDDRTTLINGHLDAKNNPAVQTDANNKQQLIATYGMKIKEGKTMNDTGALDRLELRRKIEGGYGEATRLDRARGGILDITALSTGLPVQSVSQQTVVSASNINLKKGLFGGGGADHNFQVGRYTMNTPQMTPENQKAIVCKHIKNMLPITQYEQEIHQLNKLTHAKNMIELLNVSKSTQLFDRKMPPILHLAYQAYGASIPEPMKLIIQDVVEGKTVAPPDLKKLFDDMQSHLKNKISDKTDILNEIKLIDKVLGNPNSMLNSEVQLTKIYNNIALANELNDTVKEILGYENKSLSENDKAEFERYSKILLDSVYEHAADKPNPKNGYTPEIDKALNQFLDKIQNNQKGLRAVQQFQALKKQAAVHLQISGLSAKQPDQTVAPTQSNTSEKPSKSRKSSKAKAALSHFIQKRTSSSQKHNSIDLPANDNAHKQEHEIPSQDKKKPPRLK